MAMLAVAEGARWELQKRSCLLISASSFLPPLDFAASCGAAQASLQLGRAQQAAL